MKRILILAVIAVFARAALADGVSDGVAEVTGIFQQNNLKIDDAAARRAIILAIARTADPNADIVAEGVAKHRLDELSGQDFASGFRLSISNGLPLVLEVTPDGPAAKVGLAKGDVITAIGETNSFDLITLPDAIHATRGHKPDKIDLQYRHTNSVPISTSLTLALLPLPPIECAETLPNGIFYIKVNGLFASGGEAVAEALRGWTAKSRSGVILDLRGATGDDMESVKAVASLFAKDGSLLFSVRDRSDRDQKKVKAADGKPLGVPVMALIDRDTRGASELLASVLNDSVKGAMLVGRISRGDPLVREYVPLKSGDLLYMATRQIVTAGGTHYDGRIGVKPDIQAGGPAAQQPEYDAEPVADRRQLLDQEMQDFALRNRIRGDAALRRAVDVLLGLKALNIGAGEIQHGGRTDN